MDKAIAEYEDAWEQAQQALGFPVASYLLAEEQSVDDSAEIGETGETPDEVVPGTLVNRIFLPQVGR